MTAGRLPLDDFEIVIGHDGGVFVEIGVHHAEVEKLLALIAELEERQMNILVMVLVAIGVFASGAAVGVRYEQGQVAIARQHAKDAADELRRNDTKVTGRAALDQAKTVDRLNKQLGDARVLIAKNSTGRPCLAAGDVGVLNAIAPAALPASATQPAAAAGAFATDQDVGDFIAVCRSKYGEVSSQLNQILDIEDKRQGAN